MAAYVLIFKLSAVISQAGRRGFEPRLPLHLFNSLPRFQFFLKPSNGVQRFLPSCKPLILNGFPMKNASVPRWHSSAARNPLNLNA